MVKPIPLLQDALHGQGAGEVPADFVEYFVRLHDGNWRMAQDHWERIVQMVLSTDAVEMGASAQRAIQQAVRAAVVLLRSAGLNGRCPLDPPSQHPD